MSACCRGIHGDHLSRLDGGAVVYGCVYIEDGVVIVGGCRAHVGVGLACEDCGGVRAV